MIHEVEIKSSVNLYWITFWLAWIAIFLGINTFGREDVKISMCPKCECENNASVEETNE
jgi:hypothetical protein